MPDAEVIIVNGDTGEHNTYWVSSQELAMSLYQSQNMTLGQAESNADEIIEDLNTNDIHPLYLTPTATPPPGVTGVGGGDADGDAFHELMIGTKSNGTVWGFMDTDGDNMYDTRWLIGVTTIFGDYE